MTGHDTEIWPWVIIGAGAGGGVVARTLSDAGEQVLLLERGGFHVREPRNWDARANFRDGCYQPRETWLAQGRKPFRPKIHYGVGGCTKWYGGVLLRMRREDFGELTLADGVSPAWPIGYDDLEPYYQRAEMLFHVRGERRPGPTEPPASGSFIAPAIPHEPAIAEVADALTARGLNPRKLPLALDLGGGGACLRCDTCDSFRCPLDAKWDAETACIAPALTSGRLRLMTGAEVVRLETDSRGERVLAAIVRRDGETLKVRGRNFILAAGAINSAALLLRSAPGGLANSSGLVGRNLMFHNNLALLALDPSRPRHAVFPKSITLFDYYFGEPGRSGGYPLGNLQMMGTLTPEILRAVQPLLPRALAAWIHRHSVNWWLIAEDLPLAENRVEVHPDGRIAIHYRRTNDRALRRLLTLWKEQLRAIGFRWFVPRHSTIHAVGHQCGTLRWGADPRTSVVAPDGRAHDLENLYVADASLFPSSAAVNPSLTIYAAALRIADCLLQGQIPDESAVAHSRLAD